MVFIRSNQSGKEVFVFKVLIRNLIILYNYIATALLFQGILFWGKQIQAGKSSTDFAFCVQTWKGFVNIFVVNFVLT